MPGVATGLAWTPVGGDILFVESARMPGSGKLILTGQLGDVMKESAQAALSLVKAQAAELGIDPKLFDQSDIHVHVPAGAIPKDGPSAGVAMFISLASLLKRRAVRPDVAMTGEISLRGLVLPDRRRQGEDHRRGPGRHSQGHTAGAQPPRPGGHSAKHARNARVRLGRARSGGVGGGAGRAGGESEAGAAVRNEKVERARSLINRPGGAALAARETSRTRARRRGPLPLQRHTGA